MDARGNFCVVWCGSGPGDDDWEGIYGARFASNGTSTTGAFLINTTTIGRQFAPTIAMAPSGAFVVVWESALGPENTSQGVFAQRFDAMGQRFGDEMRVDGYLRTNRPLNETFAPYMANVTMHDSGQFVVVLAADGPDALGGIYAQFFSPQGIAVGECRRVNDRDGVGHSASAAFCGDGSLFVCWTQERAPGDCTVHVKKLPRHF
jgi:hypothetical protein